MNDSALTEAEIELSFAADRPPDIPAPRFPDVTKGAGRFGAYPARLEYYDEWDALCGSANSTAFNPAFVVEGWGEDEALRHIDGVRVPRGPGVRYGHRHTLDGTDLIVWVELVSAAGEWASGLAILAREPNVSRELSGLVTEAQWDTWKVAELEPFVEHGFERFGPHRMLFGSDWPVCELAAGYGAVVQAAQELTRSLSAAERAAVFGGNAVSCYGLAPAVRMPPS